jgi:hypothetical protein
LFPSHRLRSRPPQSQHPPWLLKRQHKLLWRRLLIRPLPEVSPLLPPLRHLQTSLVPPLVFRVLETILLHQLRAWPAPVFRVPATILLHQLRAWPAPARHDPGKVSALAGPMTVALALALRSSSARVALAAQLVLDLAVRAQAARVVGALGALVVLGVLAVPVVVLVPVGVAAVPVAVPLVRSAAVVARASPASRSGRSVKSLKCGRRQA